MRRIKLTVWMLVLLLLAAFLSTALSWFLASQLPLGGKTVPRYYYTTEEDTVSAVKEDITRYQNGQTPTGPYEWAVYDANGRRINASDKYPKDLTPSRLLAEQTPTEREPSDTGKVRTLHHIEAINLGTSEPGYFLTVQTDKPTLNEYQVGNSNAFFILQVVLFILFLLLLTRWIAGLFRELERRLERLTVEPPPTDPLPPVKGPKEFKLFAQSIERIEQELRTLRVRDQERFVEQLRLITSLSHDLRTPLTSIQGFIQWLTEKHETLSATERTELLAIVTRQSETLASRIDELFTLAKLSNTDYPVERISLDLMTLTEQVVELFPGTSVSVDGPAHATLFADPMLLRRLLENLMRNATLHGTGDLRITIEEEPEMLQLTCSNAIVKTYTPEELNEWLTPFGTSDASRSSGGSGIGLSIIQQIMARHHGSVQLTSADNCFSVICRFPRHS
ncbi:sensor histidine kinase [Exiguobacterium acetylicum]|uniref:sensor histidine kinase n=1 Tax=Exiguobacterium acetylicum TaxID=41170 RepID=UPI001EE21152|nr:HAMP domain-containing sensor histidine kinase [Exiguobacterium acetylicum]UKS56383.1 HAMP domain-containing histidine kinase [Exiguobacterium acetylicum]